MSQTAENLIASLFVGKKIVLYLMLDESGTPLNSYCHSPIAGDGGYKMDTPKILSYQKTSGPKDTLGKCYVSGIICENIRLCVDDVIID